MGAKSAISWTDSSWNPVTGCSRVSPGCENCYAESYSLRMGWSKKPWTAKNAAVNVILHPDRLVLPARWRQPRKIFVNSMSDLFHEQIPDEFILDVFQVMWASAATIGHVFQVLTKRPERMLAFIREHNNPNWVRYSHRIWLGTTTEDQRRADERLPLVTQLREFGYKCLIVSAEPLLGPIDFAPWLADLDWIIDGGESGSGRRPAEIDWYRSIRDQCQAAGVPYFHKQGSAFRAGQDVELDGHIWHEFPDPADVEFAPLG